MARCLIVLLTAGLLSFSVAAPLAQYGFDELSQLPAKALKGQAEFVPGIRGKAIQLSDAVVTLPKPSRLTPAEGTVSLWLKPINWDSTKNEFLFFLQSVNPSKDGRLILYKYSGAGLGTTLWFGHPDGIKGKENTYTCTRKKTDMKQGQWYFLAATWSRKAHLIRIYINGKEVASSECKEDMFFQDFGDFLLNPPPFRPANRRYETAYDLLSFYDTPLTEKELSKLYEEESRPVLAIPMAATKPSFVTIPLMKAPPKIDGKFQAAEWSTAAKMGGFIELRNPRLQLDPDTQSYAGRDRQNFYFCFVGKIPGATRLVTKQTQRDSAVYTDDAYEIYLRPPQMEMGHYQAIFNYAGTIFDTRNGEKNWDGKWVVKNGIYEGHWTCEIAIPVSEFNSAFHENDLWKFNFCRDRQLEPDIIFSSVTPSAMPFRAWFASLRISDKGAYGRLSLNYDRLYERKLDFSLEICNPSETSKNTTVDIILCDQDGTALSKKRLTAAIAPNAVHTFRYEDPLSGFRSGIIRINATADGGERIFEQDLPLIFKDEVAIETDTDLTTALLSFAIDLKSHYRLANTATVQATIRDQEGKVLTCEASGTPVARGAFDLSGLTPGDCTMVFRFMDASGNELLKTEKFYSHIGQPRWLNEKPGASAGVVYPYTPIRKKGRTLSVIGRDHLFGTHLLPEQIHSAGVKLFAKPPVLKGKINGTSRIFDQFTFKSISESDDTVTLGFSSMAGGLEISGTMVLEFDGLLWYTVELEQKDITVDELFLEMEFPAEIAQFYNGHFFSRENYVGSLTLPMSLRRVPSLWIGNSEVGVTLAVESFQYWFNADPMKAFAFFKRGPNTVWQIRFIDQPATLSKRKMRFSFGIEANPVKPTPADFRSWRVHGHRPATISAPSQVSSEIRKYHGYNGGFTPEFISLDAFRKEVKRFRDQGIEPSLYINPTLTCPDTTEYKIFRQQWRNPYNVYPQCPASTLADLTIWQLDYLIREGGLRVIYVDSLGAVNCANPLHGCGYIDENGVQQLTWPIRAMRNYMKRLYSLLHAPGRDPKTNFLWAHMSARTSAPINAFVDFQCSGEELEDRMMAESNYMRLYPLDAFQIYYMKSSGVVPALLPNLGRIGPKQHRYVKAYNDQILSLVLLHDTMIWMIWCDSDYLNGIYRKLDQWGYKRPDLQFLSYRTQHLVTTTAPGIRISLYHLEKEQKTLAVIVNFNQQEKTVALTIDNAFLKNNQAACTDLLTGASLNPAALKIAPLNFVIMAIDTPQNP